MRLRTLLGDHGCTAALKDGSIKSDSVEFDFVDYSPTNKGFKPMVREGAFDVSEMAKVLASRWCCCPTWWWRGFSMSTPSTTQNSEC